jgi:hypothetical protein
LEPGGLSALTLAQPARRPGLDGRRVRDAARLQRNAAHTDWICDEALMARTADARYLHCLPAAIGAEVNPGVIERFRLSVARQATTKPSPCPEHSSHRLTAARPVHDPGPQGPGSEEGHGVSATTTKKTKK